MRFFNYLPVLPESFCRRNNCSESLFKFLFDKVSPPPLFVFLIFWIEFHNVIWKENTIFDSKQGGGRKNKIA